MEKLLNSKIGVAAIRVTIGEERQKKAYDLKDMSQVLRSPWNPCKSSAKTQKRFKQTKDVGIRVKRL